MIKDEDKVITADQVKWFIDNCVANTDRNFNHLCEDCPIKNECIEMWGWGEN